MTTTLWWARRDLRLADNQALDAALRHGAQVIPVFVLDPALLDSPYVGPKRLDFLFDGLRRLDKDLRARSSQLVIRRGHPTEVLGTLLGETDASAIFAEAEISPYGRRRDERVAENLPLHLTSGLTIHPPDAVRKRDGDPYRVYTPFSRAWQSLPFPRPDDIVPAPSHIPTPVKPDSQSDLIRTAVPTGVPFRSGEKEAHRLLRAFIDGDDPPVYRYAKDRDSLSLKGTSRLSPYLRFGMLSARQVVVAAIAAIEAAPNADARKGAKAWLGELIWREFYMAVLYHFPGVRLQSFRSELAAIPWKNDDTDFAAWREGRTGYPVVDAAMRQLAESGWMHNRARMIVASFLVKDLLIDWRSGERWFMQHLVDGDPAANNGGWQWTAGTGTDAAPYFRVFNPVLQGQKFDPKGSFVRRWLPELARVPDKHVHRPWGMPEAMQRAADCMIGEDYPAPIVDHGWARERALAAYAAAKESLA